MSNANFLPSVLEIIGAEKTGLSYSDVLQSGGTQTRYLYETRWQSSSSGKSPTLYHGRTELNGSSWN
jgi:hypothetical protein